MTPEEEFLYFDVVVPGPIWFLGSTLFALAIFNRPRPAANDA